MHSDAVSIRSDQAITCQLPGLEFKDSDYLESSWSHGSRGPSEKTLQLSGKKIKQLPIKQLKTTPCASFSRGKRLLLLCIHLFTINTTLSQLLLRVLKYQGSLCAIPEPPQESKSHSGPLVPMMASDHNGSYTIFKAGLFSSCWKLTSQPCRTFKRTLDLCWGNSSVYAYICIKYIWKAIHEPENNTGCL